MNIPTPIMNPLTVARIALCEKVLRKCHESAATQGQFFREHARLLIECCEAVAQAFNRGGRLFVIGHSGSLIDPAHVASLFTQPILTQRPALPAVSLSMGSPLLGGFDDPDDFDGELIEPLRTTARAGDIAFGLSVNGPSASVNHALRTARELDLLAVGFSGQENGGMSDFCDFCFSVPSLNIHRVLETHHTLLHLIWDVVHLLGGQKDVL